MIERVVDVNDPICGIMSAKNHEVIDVALSIYDPKGSYSRNAGVVMVSLLMNTDAAVSFHILHDETLSEENRMMLEKTALLAPSKSGVACRREIDFINVSDCFDNITKVDIDELCGICSRGCLYRLAMPELLPEIKEVLYFDCDIVVALDVEALWNTRLYERGYALAGVLDDVYRPLPELKTTKAAIKTDGRGLMRERYINSGVLLMNLEKMRREAGEKGTLLKRAAKYFDRFLPFLPDQDFLNAEYLGDIVYLDVKYNTDSKIDHFDKVFSIERIWHFSGRTKPWVAYTGSNADMLYWHYLSLTPWKDSVIETMFRALTNEKYCHRHSRDCIQRLKAQLKENIAHLFHLN